MNNNNYYKELLFTPEALTICTEISGKFSNKHKRFFHEDELFHMNFHRNYRNYILGKLS